MISSFLESASLAHNKEKNNEDWFYWKFRDNPFGESILACAEDRNKIIGCVALGIQDFWLKGEKIKGALSFETFVHPSYQGMGVFSRLRELGEDAAKAMGIDLLINFPNLNSLNGFIKGGWKKIDSQEYWVKGRNFWTIPFNLKQLRKGFNPNDSNFSTLKNEYVPETFPEKQLAPVITAEYLKWRFFTYPISEYAIIDTEDFYTILRIGRRGRIIEAQALFIHNKSRGSLNFSDLIKECYSNVKFDLISFSISNRNRLKSSLKKSFFIKVPNRTNFCYKILNEALLHDENVMNISLNAINYHTY